MFGVGDNVLRKEHVKAALDSSCVTSKFHISIFKVFWGRIRPGLLGTVLLGWSGSVGTIMLDSRNLSSNPKPHEEKNELFPRITWCLRSV